MNSGHSTNHREGKEKVAHNRKAGHAKALRVMGNKRIRRNFNRVMGKWVMERVE